MPTRFSPPSLNAGNSFNDLLLSHVSALENKLAFYTKSDQASRTSSLVHNILRDAHRGHHLVARRILDLVRLVNPPHPLILRIAKLCLIGPVGRVGQRRALRAVAMILLDELLKTNEKNVQAMCLRGEILTPSDQGGYNDPFTPRMVLQEAHSMFQLASTNGDSTALFLQGRWLMLNEPLHRRKSHVEEGRKLILQAIDLGCARAMNFLAETLDNANFESKDVSNELGLFMHRLPINGRGTSKASRLARERYIFSLYIQSAKQGDASAMNDLGACFSAGYAGLEKNFDLATCFYKLSIQLGSNIAYDNLGTHFETGMGGEFPEKIDRAQALKYYRDGTRERVPKCAYYMALCYDEGVPGLLTKDTDRAVEYYKHALVLADDHYDVHTGQQCIRNLSQLYLTQIKLTTNPKSKETEAWMRDLRYLIVDEELRVRTMDQLNHAISNAIRSRSGRVPVLVKILGDSNAQAVVSYVKHIERALKTEHPRQEDLALYEFIVGTPYFGSGKTAAAPKVKRTNVTRPTASTSRSTRKRRKVTSC